MKQIENQFINKNMKYYENYDDERAERIWDLCTKIVLIVFIIFATIGYFTIDFEKIDNDIKTEKNER